MGTVDQEENMNKRKLAFLLGAVMISSTGLMACEEEDPFKPAGVQNPEDPGNQTGPTKVKTLNDYSDEDGVNAEKGKLNKDMKGANKACLKSDCMTSSECADEVNYWACLCSTDDASASKCTTWAACKDVGPCTISCGPSVKINGQESCSLSVCAGTPECASACIPETLPADGDYDGDGIPNLVERNSGGLENPCLEDTDGDTIPDGYEDLNHDGVYQPYFSETRPDDPSSMPASSDVYDLQRVVCKAEDILSGSTTELSEIRIAQIKGAKYEHESAMTKNVTVFSDNGHKVVGFFGTLSDKRYTGLQLLRNSALKDGYFVEESNFTNSMPLNVWLENKTENNVPVYDKEHLQIVPDHTVSRYKYSITLEAGQTLENVRDTIAKVFDSGLSVSVATGNTSCSGGSNPADEGKAILYLARSEYKEGGKAVYAYSGALTCSSTNTASKSGASNSIEAMNMLDDVISGTLVAPKTLTSAVTGYDPFKDFVCQTEVFGNAAGTVDFIWVIDNSGSMEDELNNLTSTVKEFTDRLTTSGIDYRLAVTTTDAYLLDETGNVNGTKYSYDSQDSGGYTPLVLENNALGTDLQKSNQNSYQAKYLNYLGIHTDTQQLSCFIDKDTQQGVNTFIQNVAGKAGKPNIKGKGYEDGLKSGALALERLGLTVLTDKEEISNDRLYTIANTDDDKALFATLKRKTAYGSPTLYDKCATDPTNATCTYRMPSCNLRENALKYIIWVSDEESRQFKEDADDTGSLLSKSELHLVGCRTGYKLENSSMKTGHFGGSEAECNPPMVKMLEGKIEAGALTYDMSLEDIKVAAPDYGNMLEYYLGIYRKYAGENDVTGFALVGDIGARNGGNCPTLKICKGVCKDKDGNVDTSTNGQAGVGCFTCEGTYEDSAQAVVGADYGLSYIHMARFLSKEKEGGFASICNPRFDGSIDAIFEDVAGRVASHPLKGYPIATTIRVAVKSGNKVKELTRGAASDGWSYDASQNAIVFSGANIKKDDYIAISYVLWRINKG